MTRKGKEIMKEEGSDEGRSLKRSETSTGALNRGGGGASWNRGGGGASWNRGGASSSNNAEGRGALFWSTDLDGYCFGEFSTAVMQANVNLAGFSQVEVGRTSLFAGVYDGHGGSQAAEYVSRNLTGNLMERIRATLTMTEDNLRQAFLRTEASWLEKVDARFRDDPYIAGYGTCCLVGVFWRRILYLANVGDSRAVIAREVEGSDTFVAHQLTRDDNVDLPEVRAEVEALHPKEPDIIVKDAQGTYRIKGRIQVSRSIGDAYMKSATFNLNKVDKRFLLDSPVRDGSPALTADPNTYTIPIEPHDRFVIFASDGLWDMMTNQEVADIVQKHPREGIAARLIKEGLKKLAVRAGGLSYEHIVIYRRDTRERLGDISVVVIFFQHGLIDSAEEFPRYSIKDGCFTGYSSTFSGLDQLPLAATFTDIHHLPLGPAAKRTVYFINLPYHTQLAEVYNIICSILGGAIEVIRLGVNGFSAKIQFYEACHAIDCIGRYRNRLIHKGKLVCVCLLEDIDYLTLFSLAEHYLTMKECPNQLYVSRLTQNSITVEIISGFFSSFGIRLTNLPIMHMELDGRLFAIVTLKSSEDISFAMSLDGMKLLDDYVLICQRRLPTTMTLFEIELDEEDV